MNFASLGLGYIEVVCLPPQPLADLFYLPLAVDESLGHISISFKLLTVQPWLQARGVSAPFPCVRLM